MTHSPWSADKLADQAWEQKMTRQSCMNKIQLKLTIFNVKTKLTGLTRSMLWDQLFQVDQAKCFLVLQLYEQH